MTKKLTIAERNARWEKASPAKKRVIIARDVIQQIKTKRFSALEGIYVGKDFRKAIRKHKKEKNISSRQTVEAQKVIVRSDFKCTGCAKGAIFLADIYNRDNYKAKGNEIISNDDIINRSSDIFEETQLNLIENAFERSHTHGVFDSDAKNAIYFGEGYDNNDERLIAIMKNIISNKGTFIP